MVDVGVVPVCLLIATKAGDAVLVRDDLGLVSRVEERLQAEGVVRVAVRVNRRVQRRVTPRAHAALHGGAQVSEPGVDDQQLAAEADGVGVDENRRGSEPPARFS